MIKPAITVPISRDSQLARAKGNPTKGNPQFSGAITGAIGYLENRFLELLVTDVVGMGVTRTGIEYVKRGPDAARENAIRDATGTFFNMFSTGLFSHLLLKTVGGHLKKFNPKWVDQKSWITAALLDHDAFGSRYLSALEQSNSIPEAREQFIRNVLSDLRNSNDEMANTAFRSALGSETVAANSTLNGKLTQEGIEELVQALAHKGVEGGPNWEKPLGTYNFEAMVAERKALHALKMTEDKAFDAAKERMKLSSQYHGKTEKEALEALIEIAKRHGLSDVVDIGSAQGENLKVVLEGLRNTLHEVVDRGTEGLAGDPQWKEKTAERTFNKIGEKAKGFLPKAEDGLISYINKSKRLYTHLPIALTIVCGVSIAFLNNWLTKRKNGGKSYFPGEGKAAQTLNTVAEANSLPPLAKTQETASIPLNTQESAIDPQAIAMRRAQLFNVLEQQIRQGGQA